MNNTNYRALIHAFSGSIASDGAGVKITRVIGTPELNVLDPFLLLDCFNSDNPHDYLAGFPEHPHRGFETVTYLLHGKIRHKDSTGHEGLLQSGGVQWMSAAKGILHSEMPEQENGLLQGFQLWVNLPASAKMNDPHYQEYPPETTPLEKRENGTQIRVIAGETDFGTKGPVSNNYIYPTYMDVQLPSNTTWQQALPTMHNSFIYMIEGEITIHADTEEQNAVLSATELGVLNYGDTVRVESLSKGARFLLVAGKPLNEPIVRGGPFVMNTKEEVLQAFKDFSTGNF